MKPRALIVMYPNAADEVYGADVRETLTASADLLAPPLSAEAALARPDLLAEADVIFSGWGAPVMDEAFLVKAPKLRAVFYAAGTIRPWVTEAVWRRELIVTTAASGNAIPVAEYTVATIFLSLKNTWHYALSAKRLGMHAPRRACTGAFRAKVGLISLGAVARLVADRLKISEVEILAYDPFVSPAQAAALGVRLVPLEAIFQECDVVSLHAPLLAATRGLLGRTHFAAMKSGATFINTARGEIVREPELIEVLIDRPDLTAVLDVTHPEPPAPGSPLYSLPNVVLTPHIAGSLGNECLRLGRDMVDEFNRWVAGQPLRWRITREQAGLVA